MTLPRHAFKVLLNLFLLPETRAETITEGEELHENKRNQIREEHTTTQAAAAAEATTTMLLPGIHKQAQVRRK
jgi:hypothetical protein